MKDRHPQEGHSEAASNRLIPVPGRRAAELVAGSYLIVGILWILISDTILKQDITGLAPTYPVMVTKGLVFVIISSILIYLLCAGLTRRLRRQTEELRAVFATPELGAMRFDQDGQLESYTPCLPSLLGYPDGVLKQMNLKDLVHPEDWPVMDELLDQFRKGQTDRARQVLRFQRKAGRPVWIEQNLLLFDNKDRKSFVSTIQAIDERVRADQELNEKAGRLQAAQELAKLGDWTYDQETGKITWSRELYRIWERDPSLGPVPLDDMLRHNFSPEDAQMLRESVDRAVQDGQTYDFETTVILDNGKQKPVRVLGVPYWKKDNIWVLRGVVQDLSELSAMRERLQVQQEQLQTVVENLPGVIFQYKLYRDGTDAMTYVSEGTDILWGVTPEEAMADNQRVWDQIRPFDLGLVQESIQRSAETLKPWHCQWRSQHADGEVRWHEGSGIPRREEDGTITWNSIILDITDRISTESQLRQHQEYWELLSRHASDGIVICNASGELVFFNDTVNEWVGPMDSSVSPAEWSRAYGLYTLDSSRLLREDEIDLVRALRGEIVRNLRYTIQCTDGKVRTVESNGGPLYDKLGKQIGAMVINRDITDRFRREFEVTNAVIEASEKERFRFASELHDTVTQELSIVSLNLNNFRLENPELSANMRLIRAQEGLARAIEQTRSLSHRIMPGTVRDLGLVGAINELVGDIQDSSQLDIAFTCNVDERLPDPLELDLFRIVQESLTNILKHAKAQHVRIELLLATEHVDLTVADDGVGLEASDPRSEHLGIGLRTMRNRCRKWGGSFRIDSDAQRTIVHVTIPRDRSP